VGAARSTAPAAAPSHRPPGTTPSDRSQRCLLARRHIVRVATRYEKRAAYYLAMLYLAALRLWC